MPLPGRMGKQAYQAYRLAWSALDWIYPPRCGGCGMLGARWCETCALCVTPIQGPVCPACGSPQRRATLCERCAAQRPGWTAARAWAGYHGPIRQAIHRLKYAGDTALAEILARPMISLLAVLGWPVDAVAPVPAGLARRAERGYNQAAVLGRPLALGSGLPFFPHMLTKQRETRSQVGLTYVERRQNVAGAFVAREKLVQGRRVLVVDDVMTSGATLEACAQSLLGAGATEVYCLTLARAGVQ